MVCKYSPKTRKTIAFQALRYYLDSDVVPSMRLDEIFLLNVDATVDKLATLLRQTPSSGDQKRGELKIIPDPEFRRLLASVDFDVALAIYNVPR